MHSDVSGHTFIKKRTKTEVEGGGGVGERGGPSYEEGDQKYLVI